MTIKKRSMKTSYTSQSTTVGEIDAEILAFTAGRDIELDQQLVEVDCLGTAAHVTMLFHIGILNSVEQQKILNQLKQIIQEHRKGKFKITIADQDVHLAIERRLTDNLGELGKKTHTARSRNEQIAVDLRLLAKIKILEILEASVSLAETLLNLSRKHVKTPMVGRTHMQPAMPSSIALWLTAFLEELIADMKHIFHVYGETDKSPLGSAAAYGVPLNIDRQLVSDLLGFKSPCHNVLAAVNSRGKIEASIVSSLSLLMLTLSRIAEDLLIFSMPEFNYFSLPSVFCTGSSIMPNKNNPDVLELIRAKAAGVLTDMQKISTMLLALPSGYNRDIQESKEPFLNALHNTRTSIQMLNRCMAGLGINKQALEKAFTPAVFATDRALELVAEGMPFRDAYHHVKNHLGELKHADPIKAIEKKTHLGGTAGLDFKQYEISLEKLSSQIHNSRTQFEQKLNDLLSGLNI